MTTTAARTADKQLKFLSPGVAGNTTDYPVRAMRRAMASLGVRAVDNPVSSPRVRNVTRILARAGMVRRVAGLSKVAYLVPIMQISERELFPYCYFAEMMVYAFDCWPAQYARWKKFFRRHRMRVAFFSARQSAEHFQRELPEMNSIWLAEAVDPAEYGGGKPLDQRSIDVLELGRRSEPYHDAITAPLARAGRVHKYQTAPGKIVFPTQEGMIEGLGDAKVSVCFPSSMTHPARSGDVETVTYRYFESIASRCIIVGHAPAELVDLFGYNPVIEADMNDAAGQIEEILRDPNRYTELVDRNLRRLHEVGTWHVRMKTLLELLRPLGYTPDRR